MSYLTYNGKYVTYNGKLLTNTGGSGPVRSITVIGDDDTLYTDGGLFLCVGSGEWYVTANAAWYITYPSFLSGIISPTSGSGNATITCYSATDTGSGNIDFYWTSDDAYTGYSFHVVSDAGGCV
jgi:hypothetical protein